MQTIKKLLLGVMIFGSCVSAQAQSGVVRIATEGAYPPYNFVNPDGSLGGFDVDIANALCTEMKVQCKLVKQDWDGIIPGLLAKKYDAIVASMAITPERQQKVAFSDKYEGGYSMLFGSKGLTDSSPAAMQGKVIAVQKGSIQENFAKDHYEKAGISLHRYPDTQTAMMDLTAGRVDAVVLEVGIVYEATKDASLADYHGFGEKFQDPKYFGTGSGIAVRKQDQVLLGQFNQALKTILANGTYKQINDKYFPYNQYD
ncbi:transporter substrate-binding domain-containing protein [Pseudomonas sp.]|uniref:transporter substrate-binding domain-containing protein n=1 Tax=Pseudomonas sp. TaxID=306 RepID=UPI0027322DB3|nr:transporter substrate-binding domain-containing protein [Pseudomonas sp.]MDP3817050.1 transporter substrate-binding domain-containing protein [Pseudomonas sp.]